MIAAPLRFTSMGYGYGVCANHVLAVLIPEPAPSKRLLAEAKAAGCYLDMTCGHAVRSLLLLADGQVVGCAVKSGTILTRLNEENAGEEVD